MFAALISGKSHPKFLLRNLLCAYFFTSSSPPQKKISYGGEERDLAAPSSKEAHKNNPFCISIYEFGIAQKEKEEGEEGIPFLP